MGLDIIAASHIDFLGEKDTIINHPPNEALLKAFAAFLETYAKNTSPR